MIPFLIAGAAILGVGGHLSAKETNEKAQQIAQEAQNKFNSAKSALETEQEITKQALLKLGTSKKRVMDGSIKRFLSSYKRIKDVQFDSSIGIDELSNFSIDEEGVLELQKMTDIYDSAISSGATGAATGALIGLAASGELSFVTGMLGKAGQVFAAGEVGAAAGLAGSTLSVAAAVTPLSAIVAPAILLTGISADIKADENLEKAKVMRSQANEECEKMAVSQTLCKAIADRSNMFNKLLHDLNVMYDTCTILFDQVTKKKVKEAHGRPLTIDDFSEEECELFAVTRALTGAVKKVIDTPILLEDGTVSDEAQTAYDNMIDGMPKFNTQVNEVKSYNYHTRISAKQAAKIAERESDFLQESTHQSSSVRNILAICLGVFVGFLTRGNIWITAFIVSAIILFIMDNETTSDFFKAIMKICIFAMSISTSAILWIYGRSLMNVSHFVLITIVVLCVVAMILDKAKKDFNDNTSNVKRMIIRIFGCIFSCALALLSLAFLYGFLGLPYTLVMVILVILNFTISFGFASLDKGFILGD